MTKEKPDRRSHFATSRVAHAALRGTADAPVFSEGKARTICVPVANLHRDPETRALDRQLLFGAQVTVLEVQGSRAFLRDATMGYVGWVDRAALGPARHATHRVAVRSTWCFKHADFKSPDPLPLPFGSRLRVSEVTERYAALEGGGYVIADHLAPLDAPASDPVACAEQHLGTPYLWGGNSAFGIDCSGLVQVAFAACGLDCPGDSDQQQSTLGETLPTGTDPQRGDLMFWRGHVAWVSGPNMLLHANAFHMAVAREPCAEALSRIAGQGDGEMIRHARLA